MKRFARMGVCCGLLAAAVLLGLSACTLIYVAGDSNNIADSGNHSGSLNLPEPKPEAEQRQLRLRPNEPIPRQLGDDLSH